MRKREYRITKCRDGRFTVDEGFSHDGGVKIPGIIGCTMRGFVTYESRKFDTEKQARGYVTRMLRGEA